jgi:fructose transport system permease protein
MTRAESESGAGTPGYEQVLKKTDENVASFEEDSATPLRRLQHFLHGNPTAIPAIVLVLAVILFSVIAGQKFLHPFNFSLVLQQVTIIGIVGIAQTLIVLTAGIDLSVGAIMVLSSVVMGKFAITVGLPVPIAFVSGLIVGPISEALDVNLVERQSPPLYKLTHARWRM